MLHWKEGGTLEVKKERPNRGEEDRRGRRKRGDLGKAEIHWAGKAREETETRNKYG